MRFQFCSGLLVALLLTLGGCVTQQVQTATVSTPSGGGASPPARAPAPPAPPAPGRRVAASPGKRQHVDFIAAVNLDCSTAGAVVLDFISKAAHGTVTFEQASEFGVWSPANPRFKCNDRRVPGTAVFYTSEPTFQGVDLFVLTLLTPDGQRINVPVTVTVR
jgi:hypothetical protein